jgi:hypothetical protein
VPTLKTLPYDQYAELLSEACAWVARLGIQYSATRLGAYERLWKRLAACYKSKNLDSFFDSVPFQTFLNAAFESTEIIETYKGMSHISDVAFGAKLKSAFRGHDLYVMDNDGRSGRDIGFELYIASKFAAKGMNINFSSIADVEVHYKGRKLFIECKRLRSRGEVRTRIKDGIGQLKKRFESSNEPGEAVGILALSVTKLLNPTLGSLKSDSVIEVSETAGRHIDQFMARYAKHWSDPTDRRFLGTIISLNSPCIIERKRLFLTSQELTVTNNVRHGTREFKHLIEIANQVLGR